VVASLDAEDFLWGQDLFNHGYYWEAHEAWEGLWQTANRGTPLRAFLKALILLSAAGIKIREGKTGASDASCSTRRRASSRSDEDAG
jgi:predicted metal-dependent hydrolase